MEIDNEILSLINQFFDENGKSPRLDQNRDEQDVADIYNAMKAAEKEYAEKSTEPSNQYSPMHDMYNDDTIDIVKASSQSQFPPAAAVRMEIPRNLIDTPLENDISTELCMDITDTHDNTATTSRLKEYHLPSALLQKIYIYSTPNPRPAILNISPHAIVLYWIAPGVARTSGNGAMAVAADIACSMDIPFIALVFYHYTYTIYSA